MKKYLVAFVTIVLFGHHVICTLLYNAPVNPMTYIYQRYVTSYMEPFFMQKWLLFAPEPATSDIKLWYKVKYNGRWCTWLDPLEPVLKKHQHLRFTYNAKLLYVYGNIARDLSIKREILTTQFNCQENDNKCNQEKNDSLKVSPEFILAERYVKRDITTSFLNAKIDSVQIMVIHLYPKQFSERLSKKPFGYASSTEFDPIAFKDIN